MHGKKLSQVVMVWFLPLIVVGGLFFPLLGYILPLIMVFFLTLAFFRHRYWCWNLCPRGAFLDLVLSRMAFGKPVPRLLTRHSVRWGIFSVFMALFVYRLAAAGGDLIRIGGVFVSICVLTTILAVLLGIPLKHRAWCMVCPMGTLQGAIGNGGRRRRPDEDVPERTRV